MQVTFAIDLKDPDLTLARRQGVVTEAEYDEYKESRKHLRRTNAGSKAETVASLEQHVKGSHLDKSSTRHKA